jgi:hypothetical protein
MAAFGGRELPERVDSARSRASLQQSLTVGQFADDTPSRRRWSWAAGARNEWQLAGGTPASLFGQFRSLMTGWFAGRH